MRRLTYILLLLVYAISVHAKTHVPDSVMHRDGLYVDNLKIYSDSAIFQGATLKLDLFNTCYYMGISKGKMQTYEMALNFRLKNRFYPTLELGYAQGNLGIQDAQWKGQGGWGTVGLDINGMKKHIQDLDAILIGVRLGGALQKYDMTDIPMSDPYWKEIPTITIPNKWRKDFWGEVVAGCIVHIYSGLVMGWDIRLKVLFTRKTEESGLRPYYVPGYGYWDYSQWGFNYYIGWKF